MAGSMEFYIPLNREELLHSRKGGYVVAELVGANELPGRVEGKLTTSYQFYLLSQNVKLYLDRVDQRLLWNVLMCFMVFYSMLYSYYSY